MDINIHSEDLVTIIEVKGSIDGQTASTLQEQILPAIESAPRILLNMTEVSFMSSAGLRTLLVLHRKAAEKNIDEQKIPIILVGLSEEIRDTMSITGFLDFFTLCETIDEARRLS
ncbi:STAS domain-containing protein [Roseofilum reptotaenium CS-1145]|uniref:Anti-sigma factor antagonist n=1 Tax=Roseofilum reptotaenium AO1-A TaxID=1925591 RepID=A0A1L9QWV3_9CYAN|nr:STAS domain-containing protein [Roseofilum reptotaenium]MDB9516921.1 STAS domain-containing protein [Roseofilum reptotaenium CS-1145]OJJ27119.1 anti-sigma B factor antagonist [Roseofilum reptotaenium AO1-A]